MISGRGSARADLTLWPSLRSLDRQDPEKHRRDTFELDRNGHRDGYDTDVLKDAAQQLARLPPFVALEPEEDRRLVREILLQRSDTDPSLPGHPRGGEALRAFFRQNLNRSVQNRGDEPCRGRSLR